METIQMPVDQFASLGHGCLDGCDLTWPQWSILL